MQRLQVSAFDLSVRKALWLPVIMLVVAIGLFWYLRRETRAMLRAVRKGRRGRARVIGWRDFEDKPSKDGKPPWQIMEWRDDAHNRHGETWPREPAMVKDFPPGSEITVWYDPKSGRGFWEWEVRFWQAPAGDAGEPRSEDCADVAARADAPQAPPES